MIQSFDPTAHRLLELPDVHRARLAEFDFYPAHNLLYVSWHGRLTAPAIVSGAQAALDLFRDRALPRRLLTNHRYASGDWGEAIPWLHYEWLPQALAQGLELVSHVISSDTNTYLDNEDGGQELIEELRQQLLVRSFRSHSAAWQWATTR